MGERFCQEVWRKSSIKVSGQDQTLLYQQGKAYKEDSAQSLGVTLDVECMDEAESANEVTAHTAADQMSDAYVDDKVLSQALKKT